MSASKDKKKRQADREAGVERRQINSREEEKKKRKEKVQWTVGTILVVLLIALILIANSNLFYTVLPSVSIGDQSYTNAEYEYYYKTAYYQFCNSYSSYLSYFLDTSKPLEDQTCAFDETITWADYFRDSAIKTMTQTTALYEAAVAEGYTLSEENAASIDEQIAGFGTYAQTYGYESAKKYIDAAYGRGVTEKTVRKLMEMSYIAGEYAQDKYDSFTYTPEQLSAWYDENKNDNDTFDYLYYYVAADTVDVTSDVTDEETGETTPQTSAETTDETMAAAKATADDLAAKITDAESFKSAVAELSADAAPTEQNYAKGSSLSSAYADWMKDASRKSGDVTVAENESAGYYVVLFLNRDDNTYKTVSVRHILVKAVDEDGDGTYSDDEKAAARSAIEDIYNEWKSGEATEDSFAALANEKSEDTGSNTTGGLYENIYKGEMVTEFNDFCFAGGRKSGDTAIVYGESSSYTGYHLVYYVGTGDRYCDYLADQSLRSDDYSQWQTSAQEGYTAVQHFVLKFADE